MSRRPRKAALTMFGPCQEVPEGPYLVRLSRFAEALDPYRVDCWGHGRLRRADVDRAIREGRFAETPNEPWCGRHDPAYVGRPGDYDVERVARLVTTPATDAILLEVTSPVGAMQFLDGTHRTAAAIHRRDLWITAGFVGFVDPFHDLFPEARRPPRAPARVYGGVR